MLLAADDAAAAAAGSDSAGGSVVRSLDAGPYVSQTGLSVARTMPVLTRHTRRTVSTYCACFRTVDLG